MRTIDINPFELRDYAISHGWKLVTEALKDGLFVLNSPFNDFKQLVFPKSIEGSNAEELSEVVTKLSKIYNKSSFKLLEEIREINDDVISLRYYSDSKNINSLSFEEALESIEGTKQLILAASSSIINPVTFHPRLSRTEPNELLKKIRFRHTEEGSFVLKVSCPLEFESNPVANLFGKTVHEPFARKTFIHINSTSNQLLNSIESNTQETFISEQKKSETPTISYNFCEALIGLFDDERELPFQLMFNWSRNSVQKLPLPSIPSKLTFDFSLKSKISEVKSYLQPVNSPINGTFIATVESLNGNIGSDGKRAGEVKLTVFRESEIINARAILNSEQYTQADTAHMNPGSYIRIKGKLNPGKQIRLISDIEEFVLMDK